MLALEARLPRIRRAPALAVALIGPGRVGRALLDRIARQAPADWALQAIIDSRWTYRPSHDDGCWTTDARNLTKRQPHELARLPELLCHRASDRQVIIDTTASQEVAACHGQWVRQGIDLVSANKLALADDGPDWPLLIEAVREGRYGASATVGAGLPVIDSLNRLHAAGETVTEIRAVLSGSLSLICERIDNGWAPAQAVQEAGMRGLSEPDPRSDLSGLDVARKLVILARLAGVPLQLSSIRQQSLVPEPLKGIELSEIVSRLREFDADILAAFEPLGRDDGDSRVLYQARLESNGIGRAGLQSVNRQDPMARISDVDNRIEIRSDCYESSPLVIEGPGAGVEVTALALWSDLVRISRCEKSGR
ncbi:MAG: hypothetical protein AAGJ52_04785 [Pseudomonadota bacterium]